jgi:hypothetical protein
MARGDTPEVLQSTESVLLVPCKGALLKLNGCLLLRRFGRIGLVPRSFSPRRNSAPSSALSPKRCDAVAMSRSAGQSSASPPVRRMARRRPRASAGTFVLRPPLSPFFTRWRAVRCDVRGADHPDAGRSSISGQFPEQIFPDSAPRPADKSVADRRRWATGRAITPAKAAFQPMPNAADDATIPRSTPQHPSASKAQIRFHGSSLGQNTSLLTISIPSRQTITILQTNVGCPFA